jgi:type III restriction enzyme
MLLDTTQSIYEHVVYDSDTERQFAEALEMNDGVVLYAKLPSWLKVPGPRPLPQRSVRLLVCCLVSNPK